MRSLLTKCALLLALATLFGPAAQAQDEVRFDPDLHLAGYETAITAALGIVRGSMIRAKHIGKDIMAGLRMVVGGEIKEYTEMIQESRAEFMRRMIADGERLGADAILNVRFVTSQVMAGASELLAYGTAVKLR